MIILEGTDAVGKTSTIHELKKENIICLDRSKDMISKYMLFDYSLEYRASKYYQYLKENDCIIIFLVNNDKDELERRVRTRNEIGKYDLEAYQYNQLYLETYEYMKNRNMNIKGMIFNHYIADNIMHEDNIRMCEYMTGLPTLAKVSMGDVDLNIDIAELISLYR